MIYAVVVDGRQQLVLADEDLFNLIVLLTGKIAAYCFLEEYLFHG